MDAGADSARRSAAAARLAALFDPGPVRCAVVGLGFIGSMIMDALRASGIEAYGYDRDAAAAAHYARRAGPLAATPAPWSAGADPGVIEKAEVVIVAVRLAVNEAGGADMEPLETVAELLGRHRAERLVLLVSTVPPGTTRSVAAALDPHSTFVAHMPERIGVGQGHEILQATPHLVGGTDELATDLAARFAGRFCAAVHPVSSPEVSELSKLLENAFLSQGIALATEMTRIAHALGVSAAEICDAAATKPAGYFPFHPGFGLGGHCLPTDLRLLRAASLASGSGSALLDAVDVVARSQPAILVDRLDALMREAGMQLAGAEVLLVGMGFKVGSSDLSATPSEDIVRLLRARDATPVYADSGVAAFAVDGVPLHRFAANELTRRRFDAALILAGDRELALDDLSRCAAVTLDAGGARIMRGDRARLHRL